MIDLEDIKLWLKRRKQDLASGFNMITQITIWSTVINGKVEYFEKWDYINRRERDPDAKELSGEKNIWLVNRIEADEYPDWATDSKRLTATGAYTFATDDSVDKVYNDFKDWQHIPLKTFIIASLVIIGVAYAIFLVMG